MNYNDIQEAFDKYTQEGGMSGSYIYKTQEEKYQYISDVFNTLIIRDIKQKYNIKNTDVLNNLNNYLIDNISNLTSSNNITHFLNSNKVNITDKNENLYIQVSDYIGDDSTLKRETTPLLQIRDAYPKIIIARTRHEDYQYEGIQIYDIANWLANKTY